MATCEMEELRAGIAADDGAGIGVDDENNIIFGIVVAQLGQFQDAIGRPDPRGEFDGGSLAATVRLMRANAAGAKAHFGHLDRAEPSGPEALESFLGRFKNPRITGDRVRADLYLDPVAMLTPPGGGTSRGEYLMTRAKSDPASFGASLVLDVVRTYRMDNHNKPRRDASGAPLPPIWTPTNIAAIDIVECGAATRDGLLAATTLPTMEHLRLRWENAKRKAGVLTKTDDEFRARNAETRQPIASARLETSEQLRANWRVMKSAAGVREIRPATKPAAPTLTPLGKAWIWRTMNGILPY